MPTSRVSLFLRVCIFVELRDLKDLKKPLRALVGLEVGGAAAKSAATSSTSFLSDHDKTRRISERL